MIFIDRSLNIEREKQKRIKQSQRFSITQQFFNLKKTQHLNSFSFEHFSTFQSFSFVQFFDAFTILIIDSINQSSSKVLFD